MTPSTELPLRGRKYKYRTDSERFALYKAANPEKARETRLRWIRNNPERVRAIQRASYERNKDRINEQRKANRHRDAAYMRERRRADLGFRILCSLRVRIWHALKNAKGTRKCARTIELVGCSLEQLKAHLESRFQQGMSWANYGEWHIDHIRPCAKFDLTLPDQQKLCFHYSNLQPLWAIDNKTKSDKEIQ